MPNPLKIENLIGKKINQLTLLKEVNPHITKGGNKHRQGLFLCKCGQKKIIQISSVISNRTKSCGCLSKKIASDRLKKENFKHGFYNTPEYNSWISMKKRCLNKNHKAFDSYGGRGIFICQSWIDSFDNFINDMGKRPNKNFSLDRIDNNDGYYKENCRWASKKDQCMNQRSNRRIEAFGEDKCLSEWASILGFSWQKLYYRLFISKNYSLEKMLNEIGFCNRD